MKQKKLFIAIAFVGFAGTLFNQIPSWNCNQNSENNEISNKKVNIFSAGYFTSDLLNLGSAGIQNIINANEMLIRLEQEKEQVYDGTATFYSDKLQGNKTANGEFYDKEKYTAAIRYNAVPLPFGTIVEVTNLKTNKKVIVKINDRMSSKAKAKIDLSRAAFEQIANISDGRIDVTIRVIN